MQVKKKAVDFINFVLNRPKRRKKVFIASPDIYHVDPNVGALIKRDVWDKGYYPVWPLDVKVKFSVSESVKQEIKDCDYVIADVSVFRSASEIESSVSFVIGYASALGIPVFAYDRFGMQEYKDKVKQGRSLNNYVFYGDKNMVVESFGLPCNILIYNSVTTYITGTFYDALKALENYERLKEAGLT